MKPKHRRLFVVVLALSVLGAAAALVLNAFEENLVFFYSPTDLEQKPVPEGQAIRVGGLVEATDNCAVLRQSLPLPEILAWPYSSPLVVFPIRRSLSLYWLRVVYHFCLFPLSAIYCSTERLNRKALYLQFCILVSFFLKKS